MPENPCALSYCTALSLTLFLILQAFTNGGGGDGYVCWQIVLNSHFLQCTDFFSWNIIELQGTEQRNNITLFYCCQVYLSFAVCLSFVMAKKWNQFFSYEYNVVRVCVYVLISLWKGCSTVLWHQFHRLKKK